MKKVISLLLVVSFLFSFLVVNNVEAQRGTVIVSIGTLFQDSDGGNNEHLNANYVVTPDGKNSLVERSNLAVPKLQSDFLLKTAGVFVLARDRKRKIPISDLVRKKLLRDFAENEHAQRVTPGTIPTDKSVGIIRYLSFAGRITHVNFVGVLLKSPDFIGEDFNQFVSSLALNYYNGSSLTTVFSSKIGAPIQKRILASSEQIVLPGMSPIRYPIRYPIGKSYGKRSLEIVQYEYPNMSIVQMPYPDPEDAPGFVDFVTTRDPFNYFLYLISIKLPQPIIIPASGMVGFSVRAGEVGNGDFLLTVGKDFDMPEDQDGYIVYFQGPGNGATANPIFFETSYGPLCADHLCENDVWPAFTRANIQIVAEKLR